MTRERRASLALPVSAALVTGAAAGVALSSDLVLAYPRILVLLVPATVGWLLASAWSVRRDEARPHEIAVVLAVTVATRLALTVPEGPLSDDLYRYLWDGRVANAGISPFRYAPDAAELSVLRDGQVWARINHPDIPTIYPPVAQLSFRILDFVSGAPRAPRVAAALVDSLTTFLLVLLLRRRGRSPTRALIYGWCPLAWLESGGGGHVDGLGVVLLAAALLVRERRTGLAAGATGLLLGLSALVKPLAPLVVPALAIRMSPARRGLLALGGLVAMLAVIPHLGEGTRLFTGLRAYAESWRFNDAVYTPLVHAGLMPRSARVLLLAATLLVAFLLPLRGGRPLATAGSVVGAALVLSPTVHPWYALWLLVLLPFLRGGTAVASFSLLALLPVTYFSAWNVARGGSWIEPAWMPWVVWGIPGLLLMAGAVRTLASRGATA